MNLQFSLRWLIWSIFFLLIVIYVASSAKMSSDMRQFIPDGNTDLIQAINHGPNGKFLYISLANGSPESLAKLNHELSFALRDSNFFSQVINGLDNGNNQLSEFLFVHRYLLTSSSADDFSAESIEIALKQRLAELRSSFSDFPRKYLQSDPTGATVALFKKIRGQNDGIKHLHQTLFTSDEKHSLLFVWLKQGANHIGGQEKALDYIHDKFDQLNQANINISISGLASVAVTSKHQIKNDSQQLTMLGSLIIFIFIFIVYRSLAIVFLIAVPLVSGILAGTLAVLLLYGEIHGITLAFGIILLGVAIDYPVHVFTHKASSRQDKNVLWSTIYVGATTTIIGFLSLVLSSFNGLQQLGIFACGGLLSAVFVTRCLLTNQQIKQINPYIQTFATKLFNRLAGFKYDKVLLVVIMIMCSIFIGSKHDDYFQTDIRNMGLGNELKPTIINIADTGRLILIKADNADEVLKLSELISIKLDILVGENTLQSYEAPSDYIPSTEQQQKNLAALPEGIQLNKNLRAAREATPFKVGTFSPFVRAIEEAKQQKILSFNDFRDTLLYTKASQRLFKNDKQWLGLINLSGISNENTLIEIAEHYGSHVSYINVSANSSTAIQVYQQEMIVLCLLGLCVISLILLVRLGLKNAAITLLPIFSAISLTLVLLFILGHKLTIFHIASLLLVLGLSLDYSLFSQKVKLNNLTATATSLMICSISTVSIFALLASSSILVLNAIGTTVFIGSLIGFLFSMLAADIRCDSENI